MTVLRAQVTMPRTTAIPGDSIVNTFHFDTDVDTAVEATYGSTIQTRLNTLYTALAGYFSSILSGVCNLKIYDLQEGEPRAPIHTGTWTLTGLAAADFPAEVAVCASYYAAGASGESMRRRRGRLYFGPTNSTTRGAVVNGDVTVLASARTAINTALKALADASDPKWCVFSPTTAGAPAGGGGAYTLTQLAAAANDVAGGWCDDRYDTQRRRGADPTTRTTWTAA